MVQHHIEEKTTEEKFEQMHVARSIMKSPMYPRTRSKKKHDSGMIEKERSFLFVPRRPRKKMQEEPTEKEKYQQVEIVELPTISKEVNKILQRMEGEVQEELLEKDSYFEHAWIGDTSSHSFSKETVGEERELHQEEHLKKIEELTRELEVNKILERHLKKENKMYKQNNKNLIKENEKLYKKTNILETKNILISKQAYRWLNEKNTWKYKYERQKVMATIYKGLM